MTAQGMCAALAVLMVVTAKAEAKEIREPAVQVALDVPDGWVVETEGGTAAIAHPPDQSFTIRIKAMEYGNLTDAKVEGRAKELISEYMDGVVIDERPKAFTAKGLEGHELAGHGKLKKGGEPAKFFAAVARIKDAPKKGVLLIGMGTAEGYDQHHKGVREALTTLHLARTAPSDSRAAPGAEPGVPASTSPPAPHSAPATGDRASWGAAPLPPGGGSWPNTPTAAVPTNQHQTKTVSGWTMAQLFYNPCWIDGYVQAMQTGVSGIWFSSPNRGVVAMHFDSSMNLPCGPVPHSGTYTTPPKAGALLKMTGPAAWEDRPLVDGTTAFTSKGGRDDTSFWRLIPSAAGLIATTDEAFLVASSDQGASFAISPTGIGDPGKNTLYWLSKGTQNHWTALAHDYYLWRSKSAKLSAQAKWESDYQRLYAQSAEGKTFYVSPAGDRVIYPYISDSMHMGVQLSTDSGATFKYVAFPGLSATLGPTAITFCDGNHGFAVSSWFVGGAKPYVYFTSDGGESWSQGALPDTVQQKKVAANVAFMAPDCKHGWFYGASIDYGNQHKDGVHGLNRPTLYMTADGGKTFSDLSANLDANPDVSKVTLWTGFALDEKNIWLGGQNGALLHSKTGGQ